MASRGCRAAVDGIFHWKIFAERWWPVKLEIVNEDGSKSQEEWNRIITNISWLA